MIYRFVGGSQCDVHGPAIKLDKFGQSIELTDELAHTIALGGGVILPGPKFDALGFTTDELKKYALPGQRVSAPAEFIGKIRSAWSAYHEWKTELEAPVPQVETEHAEHAEELTHA